MFESHSRFHSANDKRRILVVEDEQINREILGFMLEASYDVCFAETGAEALRILDEDYQTLSLVLLDLNLPDMKGIDILHRIKGNGNTAVLPIIVMTADQDAEVECLSIGATDFISKPYPKQEIVLARIRRTIELFEGRDILHWTERDHLTGLYNSEFFYRYAIQIDSFHPHTPMDAIVLDINHFHMLNERFGNSFGNEALKRVAEALLAAVSDTNGIVSRKTADTFLIYCPHRTDYQSVLDAACVELTADCHVRARMGVYSEVDRSIDIERRFDRAKRAADTVRNSYPSAIGFYDDTLHKKELFAEQLLEDFRTAIREKQFLVYYQPKFDIRSAEPVLHSAEALVRWKHSKLGLISPGIFIPLFEKNGFIRELDSYVWKETADRIRCWREKYGRSLPVSVNVSRIDLNDPPLLEMLESTVDEAGIAHRDFLLEITESAYTEDADLIINVVKTLREHGFTIEMDDFGTGYSSLNMITKLPIDTLKLDLQFIRTAFQGKKDTRTLEAVIGLAHSLGLATVAEGVETEEQLCVLKTLGCDIVQGYYFSKPLPPEAFEVFLQETKN